MPRKTDKDEEELLDRIEKKYPGSVIDISGLSTVEVLLTAAALLDEEEGPRSPKFYQRLAAQVRELADRLIE